MDWLGRAVYSALTVIGLEGGFQFSQLGNSNM